MRLEIYGVLDLAKPKSLLELKDFSSLRLSRQTSLGTYTGIDSRGYFESWNSFFRIEFEVVELEGYLFFLLSNANLSTGC